MPLSSSSTKSSPSSSATADETPCNLSGSAPIEASAGAILLTATLTRPRRVYIRGGPPIDSAPPFRGSSVNHAALACRGLRPYTCIARRLEFFSLTRIYPQERRQRGLP